MVSVPRDAAATLAVAVGVPVMSSVAVFPSDETAVTVAERPPGRALKVNGLPVRSLTALNVPSFRVTSTCNAPV